MAISLPPLFGLYRFIPRPVLYRYGCGSFNYLWGFVMATKQPITLDGKYRTACGYPWKTYSVNNGGTYPVHGAYLEDGVWRAASATEFGIYYRGLSSHRLNLIDDMPDYASWPIDAKVIGGWNYGETKKVKGHFCGVSRDGNPIIFYNGQTSFTGNGETVHLDYAELAE